MTASKYLIIIAGPTAVGKTDLAIQLAHQFNAEIISADSRQYYKELSIGTAKPSLEDQKRIIHHFVDSLSIHDPYSIGQFERDVLVKLEDRFIEMDTIIMTGGSGMHIRAISHGLDEFPFVPTKVRDRIAMLFKQHGIQVLQELLQAKDPEYAQMVDMDNPHRLIRA
ncbi:MAG: tRNA (adenosine(37)-N6)-dimethylallyltransferase MiaA, partial [Bacteroidia bacterium]|nr:tRNA (adenosine(37)-N6)-dimethylallyltransferase MiaA [Bacteroidia bacterium]